MTQITISPNKKEKTIFLATQVSQYQELMRFVASLEFPTRGKKIVTFSIEKEFVECNISISTEKGFENVLQQLKEKSEVRYIIEPYEEYDD